MKQRQVQSLPFKWVNKLEAWNFLKFWKYYYSHVLPLVDLQDTIPHRSLWFKAFELCPPDRVKVVIVVENPYPKKEHNHGLALSVPASVEPLPAPTRTFLDELQRTFDTAPARSGDLSAIAERGCLFLSINLTCREGKPAAHSGAGWGKLTFEVVRHLSTTREGIVFVLVGDGAQELEAAVDADKHCVILAPHPSPLAAIGRDDFSSARVFVRAHEYNPTLDRDFWRL